MSREWNGMEDAFNDGYETAVTETARDLLNQIKYVEDSFGGWPGGDVVDVLCDWFTRLGLNINGPGPRSCEICGELDEPAEWHDTKDHGRWALQRHTVRPLDPVAEQEAISREKRR